jgi:hypothetical protein
MIGKQTRGLEIWKIMLLFLLFSCAVRDMNDARGICFSFVMHGIEAGGGEDLYIIGRELPCTVST